MRPAAMIDRKSFAIRLWRKACIQGRWTPQQLDLDVDRRVWAAMSEKTQRAVKSVCGLFLAGEKAVTLHLLPLLQVMAVEKRLEDELYLTSFLHDEAKHVDLFCRFFEEVALDGGDAPSLPAGYSEVLEDKLEAAMMRLYADRSVQAQVRASVTYTIVVEGIMADTGCFLLKRMLTGPDRMPGLLTGLHHLQRDEARHIAFGLYLLSQLVAKHGDAAYLAFLECLAELKPIVERSTEQLARTIDCERLFGIGLHDLMDFSRQRFASRMQTIVKVRARTLRHMAGNTS
jgi:ribonucleoside-diphosphate reductase beta chain